MSWFLPAKSTAARSPRHVEIWGELEQQNRFLRRLAVAASAWAFLALAVAAYALNLALFHPIAFHVDADGRSTFVGRLRETAAPTDAEVRFVAKEFLNRYAALNSLTIESDLAEAWNLMTDGLRAEHERMLADYERDHQKEFVVSRVGDPAAFTERDVEALVTLVRCPRTEATPNGLLVAKVSTRFFVADDRQAEDAPRAPTPDPSSAPPAPQKE